MSIKLTRKVRGHVRDLTDVHHDILDIRGTLVDGELTLNIGIYENKAAKYSGELHITREKKRINLSTAATKALLSAIDTQLLAHEDYDTSSLDN